MSLQLSSASDMLMPGFTDDTGRELGVLKKKSCRNKIVFHSLNYNALTYTILQSTTTAKTWMI